MLASEINRSRRLGVEYEMAVPLVGTGSGTDIQNTIARLLTSNGIRAIARGYSHAILPANIDVAVEYDSSVSALNTYQGLVSHSVEIKTRILNGLDDWERVIPKTLEIVKFLGARVNVSCGHHVHIALDEATNDLSVVRSLYSLVHRLEPVIYGCIAPSRATCGFARPLPSIQARLLHGCETRADFQQHLGNWDRYRGLNLSHVFSENPHIEFRYHQGTLEAAKARNWLRFLLRLTDHAVARSCHSFETQLTNDRRGIERLLVCLGLKVNSRICPKVSPELREVGKFMLERWKTFNTVQSSNPQPEAA